MLVAAGAEAAGLYGRVARLLARRGTVRGRVLMVLLTGSGVTAVLSNDATPLVLTPAIFAAGPAGARATTDSAFAATFIADGASLLLPVSNPVNLLFFERFELGFWGYLAMVTPAAAAGAAVLAAVTMRQAAGEEAASAPVWTASARPVGPALVVVAGLGAAYVGAGVAGFPLGLVTLAGGLAMAAAARLGGPVDGRQFRRHIAPGVLAFVAGLVLLVENVVAAGALDWLAGLLGWLEGGPALVTVGGAAVVAAVLANLMNNWPAALVIAAAIGSRPGEHEALVTGALIGSTLGANFTMVGSLSTVFWVSLSRQYGASYGVSEYARRAFVPTLAGMAARRRRGAGGERALLRLAVSAR
ncbi:MAG: arsenic transporter [Tepidiforma sp.]|nr:MAG: arsenic transporter [Tepidiforma sp.]